MTAFVHRTLGPLGLAGTLLLVQPVSAAPTDDVPPTQGDSPQTLPENGALDDAPAQADDLASSDEPPVEAADGASHEELPAQADDWELPPPPVQEEAQKPRRERRGYLPRLPRHAVVPAYYSGVSFAFGGLEAEGKSHGVGPGGAIGLAAGIAFWGEIPINLGVGVLLFRDRAPFTELVMTCTTYNDRPQNCQGPYEEKSSVSGTYVKLDAGYQRRFQLADGFAITPGLLAGYQWNPDGLTRSVECKGCKEIPIRGIRAEGAYLAPTVRMTLGVSQFYAISARFEWFFSELIARAGVIGLEFLAP